MGIEHATQLSVDVLWCLYGRLLTEGAEGEYEEQRRNMEGGVVVGAVGPRPTGGGRCILSLPSDELRSQCVYRYVDKSEFYRVLRVSMVSLSTTSE